MSKPVPTTAQPSKKYVALKRSKLNPVVKSRAAAFPSMPDAGSLSMPDASSLTPDWDEQCGKFACPKCAPLCVPIQMFKWCFIILLAPLIALCLVFSSPLLFWVSAGKDAAKVAGGKPGKFLTAASDVLFWLFMPLMLEEYCIFKMACRAEVLDLALDPAHRELLVEEGVVALPWRGTSTRRRARTWPGEDLFDRRRK